MHGQRALESQLRYFVFVRQLEFVVVSSERSDCLDAFFHPHKRSAKEVFRFVVNLPIAATAIKSMGSEQESSGAQANPLAFLSCGEVLNVLQHSSSDSLSCKFWQHGDRPQIKLFL